MDFLLFTENNRDGCTDTEFAFDEKLGIADGADVLDDGKTKSCAADTLGVGFIHSVEALAQARQMLFFNTDTRILNLKANACVRFGN